MSSLTAKMKAVEWLQHYTTIFQTFKTRVCETFQLHNGKGINAEFPSNKPNRIKKLFPCCSSRKHRVDHRYTCDFVFIITLFWSFSDLPVASSRISRVLARCKSNYEIVLLDRTSGHVLLEIREEKKKI